MRRVKIFIRRVIKNNLTAENQQLSIKTLVVFMRINFKLNT